MKTSRRHTVASALGALLLLLCLLIGVPIALWALAGSPIPTSLPSLSSIVDGLTEGPIADSTIIRGVALIGWLAWLQIALSMVLETTAWARGLTSPKLIAAGPIQPAIRRLIATAALLLSSPTMAAAAIPAPPAAVVSELVVPPQPVAATLMPVGPVAFDASTAAVTGGDQTKVLTVQRRDTLWGLAETHLGDPFRWPELYELNKGCVQPDGRSLQDPDLIVVGWQLTFPDDAVDIGVAGVPSIKTPPPASDAASEPPAIEAEPEIVAPTTTAPTTTAVPEQSVPTSARASQSTPAEQSGEGVDTESSGLVRPLIVTIGGGLLAASIVVLIDRFRRIRTRKRQTREPLGEQLQRTEIKLRHGADLEGATRLDLALRALATGLHNQDGPTISIMAVRLVDGDIDVLLDRPAPAPPEGFESTGDPRGWQLRPGIDDDQLRTLANGATSPLPSLVTVGLGDGDPVLIDLETAGILTIGGEHEQSMPYLRRIATELSTSVWTDHLDLITVGEPLGDIAGSHRVRHYDDSDEAVRQLLLIATATGDQLDDCDMTTTLEARCADDHGDGWIPTILISSEPLGDELTTQLGEKIVPGRGVGVIVPGPIPAKGWHADISGDKVVLAPHNMTLETVTLEVETAGFIDQILTDLTIDPPIEAPKEVAQAEMSELEASGMLDFDDLHQEGPIPPFPDDEAEVEFRVLGGIDVVGIGPIERRKSMEIATYLALHSPEGVTDDRIKMVFWPDEAPSKETFNTTMSMTRSALGTDSDGELLLPHYAASHQRYRMTEKVTTDLARFEARAAYAKTAPPAAARRLLEEALGMVRGQPFDVSRGYEWAFGENFVTRAAIAVADAAQQLAEMALDAGDTTMADWAASRGLLAAPGDEGLYRIRMRAAKASGNTTAIRQIMNELCESVEANEPYDQLDPETVELYETLTGKSARSLSAVRHRG